MCPRTSSETVIEGINKIGSAFYGPILAAFLAGVLSRRATGRGVITGVVAGVAFNVGLWIFVPNVYWMWWNLFGLVITVAVTLAVSRTGPPPRQEAVDKFTLLGSGLLEDERKWIKTYAILAAYFVVILLCTVFADAFTS